MVKVTYKPKHAGDPQETEWDGRRFRANEPVEFDGRNKAHKDFVERARTNPWFDVDGESAQQKSGGKPTTPEEYRAYAIDWINNAKSADEMQNRWTREEGLRAEVGWGSDDQSLLDPIYAPKLERLKAEQA